MNTKKDIHRNYDWPISESEKEFLKPLLELAGKIYQAEQIEIFDALLNSPFRGKNNK